MTVKLKKYEIENIKGKQLMVRSKKLDYEELVVGGPVFAMYQRIVELEKELDECQKHTSWLAGVAFPW